VLLTALCGASQLSGQIPQDLAQDRADYAAWLLLIDCQNDLGDKAAALATAREVRTRLGIPGAAEI
jgi:pantoate kinase